jgi:hypothetical protein
MHEYEEQCGCEDLLHGGTITRLFTLKLPVLLGNFFPRGFICQAEQNRVSPSCALADATQQSFKPLVETGAKSHNSNKKNEFRNEGGGCLLCIPSCALSRYPC